MTKKASSSFRQSVLIDTKRHPELAYLERLTGWGERSAEIVRLARLGAECELQERELLEQFRTTARRRAMAQVNATAAGFGSTDPRNPDPDDGYVQVQPVTPVKNDMPAPSPPRAPQPISEPVAVVDEQAHEEEPTGIQAHGSNNTENSLLSQFLR